MINRRFLIITAALLHIAAVSSLTDHLVPPPPPQGGPTGPQLQIQPPAVRQSRPQAFLPSRQISDPPNEPPGFMQRIARWFGFSNGSARDQQLQGSQQYSQYKDGRKEPCGLCNKYPWIPMFPGSIQYPLSKHYQIAQANQIHQVQWNQEQDQLHRQQQQKLRQQEQDQLHRQQQQKLRQQQEQLAGYNYAQQQHLLPQYPPLNAAESQYAPAQFQPPLIQRAIQFNPQPSQDFRPPPPPPPAQAGNPPLPYIPQAPQHANPPPQYTPQPHFAPIPIPNLSPSPIPPIYDAQPFRTVPQQQQQQRTLDPTQFQQLPKFEPTVQFQDQTQPAVYTEQQPPSFEEPSQFEQIQNNSYHQINENIGSPSEIQNTYPTQTPPSTYPQQQLVHQAHTTPSFEIIKSHQITNFVSEIEYPPNYEQSQSIDVPLAPPTTTLTPEDQTPVTLTEIGSYSSQYTEPSQDLPAETQEPDSIVYHNHQEVDNYPTDNYPSASSHNLTVQHENHLDIDPIQHSSSENYYPQNEVFIPTPLPTTAQPQFVTDVTHRSTTVEIVPSLQTTFTQRLNYKRDRETPKRLLDSPINYIAGGSSPRPFTRDPSDIHIRAPSNIPPYPFPRNENPSTSSPWQLPPTPTSTYTSLDASGQFAGMTPPAQQQTPKQFHQIIIPYTTKHKPRPFQPKEQAAGRYKNWATSGEFDTHERQESKVVTATQAPTQRTTKYLTKILATNLRELLKKEHEVKNKSKPGFDLSKLQKNIDDWTEQEFTSLSHRASTVSLRGHSKHIPTEYLTTTPTMREAKSSTTSPSNHLEPLLYRERGNKRYEFKHVDDNRIEAHESSTTPVPSTTPTTTTSTTSSTTEAPTVTPFYVRAIPTTQVPKENWNQVKVTVSPLTKEKLYVVTPQPKHTPSGTGNFKSPRFIVRPTPASAGSNTSPRPSLYTPELFGLMGLSAYIPAAPVETIDGHSKVITIVTPSNSLKTSASTEASSSSKSAATSDSSNGDRPSS